ncbi:FAD binding domain-containing protein [Microthyrium microscopicum]|uniref:FAD binding domain-containing protein n=1 Tax=Microthyrium microscopicum TaxID=703497 RepID=A0A6A6TZZ5_9PEZI|nr:FAD binding domain-containing protein [Microthyrium microscopicum]
MYALSLLLLGDSQTVYWNIGCGTDLKPTCILYPKTVEEVSHIVKLLNQNNETFAVKSGGHSPNKRFASIDGGPLIALQEMTQLNYDNATQTIAVGPGNRWQHVVQATGKYGRSVVSGRLGHVGVPGLLLGGGLSFLSAERGWASTHVVEYQLVLPNGTITTASRTHNPDLHRALQSGGGQFGIVTRFTLNTFEQGPVWGGVRFYNGDKTPQLLAAVRDFTEYYPDPRAGLILTAETTLYGYADLWVMFYFWNGASPPAHVFENFTKLPPMIDTVKTQSYTDLVYANNAFVLNGSYYSIATETLPLPDAKNGVEVMTAVHNHWKNTSAQVSDKIFGSVASVAYQPMPKLISQQTKKYGGNVMDMGEDGHRIILEYDYSYINGFAENERIGDKANRELYSGVRSIIQKFMNDGKLPNISTPLFMNDAYHAQDFWGRFKERDFMKSVKAKIDPGDFFGKRTHGWKL